MRKIRFLRRAAVLLLAIMIAIPSVCTFVSAAGTEYSYSGYKSLPKLSPAEIKQLLADNPIYTVSGSDAFDPAPSVTAPYAAGKVRDRYLKDATARLNALRRLAGLDPVTLDASLSEEAQYGAVLLTASQFSHTPSRPSDMSEDFYEKGYSATSSSNLYAGRTLMGTPAGFMQDTDSVNINVLGHRRWQLNPSMGKVGFGYAFKNGYPYTVEKVFDRSASVKDYDFISWPASGYFPTGDWFYDSTAWSVTVNPSKYKAPDINAVKVTLTKTSTGQTWNFSAGSSDGFFNVDNQWYGVQNCIIFRPEPYGEYSGEFIATVTGLQKTGGGAASVSFRVVFFDCDDEEIPEDHVFTDSVTPPTCTEAGYTTHTCTSCGYSYTDTYVGPLGHSVVSWTEKTAPGCTRGGTEEGVCSRCGGTVTRNTDPLGHNYTAAVTAPGCTESGFTTHVCERCGDSYVDSYVGALGHDFGAWTEKTAPGCTAGGTEESVCERCGETKTRNTDPLGHDFGTDGKADFCSRCGEANVTVAGFTDVSPDDYFADPVRWAVKEGVTTGTGATTFSPDEGCTRGQVVTFLWRAAGSPEPTSANNPFYDVVSFEYYYKAVLWATEKGITTGTSTVTFSPNDVCTRGQIVTFLWRAEEKPAPSGVANPFSDVRAGDYYCGAVLWAVERGITNGTDKTHFSPNATCTRGQVVTFLYRDMG